ncbi:MAG: glycine cleavage system aminomethyltransferase GcvT [Candidatus Bathyarchaeia archaeon]
MKKLGRTHLYEFHLKNGHLIEFAGFEMPAWYEGIIPEHLAVRNAVGIFDITHMGRCLVRGKDANIFLNNIFTRDVASLSIGQGRYSVMCNEKGGIIDDLVVFRLEEEQFLIVYNASNRQKDFTWINGHAKNFQVETRDVSDEVVMLAVQGPKAIDTLQTISDVDLAALKYYWGRWAILRDFKVFLTRTGYTGEDGFEIFLWGVPLTEPEKAEKLWEAILKTGEKYGIKPCGLGARDTLRLEAGMCLYGNDINENVTPLEAGLDFAVQFEKGDFIGKEALLKQKAEGVKRVRVGVRALDRGVLRPRNNIFSEDKEIGYLTSGTFSPLLKCGIGMGYVTPEHSQVGTRVVIKAQKSMISAEIVRMPFYDETKYGRRRRSL